MNTFTIIVIMSIWGLACWFVPKWVEKLYYNYRVKKIKPGAIFENNNFRKEEIYTVKVVSINIEEDYVAYLYKDELKESSVHQFVLNYV